MQDRCLTRRRCQGPVSGNQVLLFFSGMLICVAPLTHLLRSTLLFSPCSIYSLVLFACSLARSLIYGKGWSSSRRRTLDVIPIIMQVKQGSYGTLCVTILPSVHPSVCLCIHPSVCPSVHLPMFVCVTWHYRPKVSKDDDACEPRYYNTTHKWSGAGRAV